MEEQIKQPENEKSSEQKKHIKETLLTSSEGRILLFGVALAFMYILWLGINLLYSPEKSQILIGMTATNIMFGRAAAMAFGYSLFLGHSTVIPVCITIETILVLIIFPLFVFSWRHLLVMKWLKNVFERIHRSAEAHKGKIQKYGVIGLFLFVWFPFWMTGPVVGCVIGFLLGLKAHIILPVVLAGTYLAIFGWAFLLRQLHDHVASYSSYAAMILMALLIVIIVTGHLLYRALHENKNKT
jgi:uncharacterized membrane protein